MKKTLLVFLSIFALQLALLIPFLIKSYGNEAKTLITPLTTSMKRLTTKPTEKPLDEWILFVSDRSGNYEIYQMNLASKETINLTTNPGEDMNPQISPDGKFMVFYSNRDGQNNVYKMNLTDHTLMQLTNNGGNNYDPSYSHDGQAIVFKSTRDDDLGDIFVMNPDGTGQVNLTPSQNTTEEWSPRFSNDGKRILFVMRSNSNHLTDEIYAMQRDGSQLTQLTNNAFPDWYPAISPKNDSMVYISKETSDSDDDLYLMRSGEADRTRLTNLPGNDADPAWDQDGKRIIFINDNDGNYDLYLMNADGSDEHRLDTTSSDELSPVFLPTPTPQKTK